MAVSSRPLCGNQGVDGTPVLPLDVAAPSSGCTLFRGIEFDTPESATNLHLPTCFVFSVLRICCALTILHRYLVAAQVNVLLATACLRCSVLCCIVHD